MCWDVKQADTCWHRASRRPASSRPGHMYNAVPAGWSRCGNKGVISYTYDGNVQKQDRFRMCVFVCISEWKILAHECILCVHLCLWNCDGIKKPLESVCVHVCLHSDLPWYLCVIVYITFSRLQKESGISRWNLDLSELMRTARWHLRSDRSSVDILVKIKQPHNMIHGANLLQG